MEREIFELIRKYGVEIELKFKTNRSIAIINNDEEIRVTELTNIKEGIIEYLKIDCESMYNRKQRKQKKMFLDLEKRANNKETFPDNLFKT